MPVREPINIYCDESTHLPRDGMPFMVLGAVACATSLSGEASGRIREIKRKHGLPDDFEIKWSKVSPSKVGFYRDVIDYFFDDDDLSFRAVVAPKARLDHDAYDQSHDDWYYKMIFLLIRNLLQPEAETFIYLDKKDTRGGEKVRRLHVVLANSQYDFDRKKIRRVQIVESHHVNLLQVADLIAGAVNYTNRGLRTSSAKSNLAARVRERSHSSLVKSTLPSASKFNIFCWQPR